MNVWNLIEVDAFCPFYIISYFRFLDISLPCNFYLFILRNTAEKYDKSEIPAKNIWNIHGAAS